MLDRIGAAPYLPLVARSPVIRPRFVRRLIIETLLSSLRLRVLVVHYLDSIEVASPIALSCVGSGCVLPRAVMIPLESVACSLRCGSEVSLVAVGGIGRTFLADLDLLAVLFLRRFAVKLLWKAVWRIGTVESKCLQ